MLSQTMRMTAARKMPERLMTMTMALAVLALMVTLAGAARAGTAELETAMDAVLVVRSDDAEDRFLGSAFLWGEEAVVAVTNAHVVGAAEEVRLVDRNGEEMTGLVIARDAVRDVAVISVPPRQDGSPRRGLVAAADPAGLGLEVYALGAPLGVEFTLTEGLISATARQVEIQVPMVMLQHDAAVNPGSSGGPLVDAMGRLVGMNSQIADGSRMFVGIAYAIPAGDLDRIVTGLIDE
ncbi:MAG: serine protease, partial [Fuscovulum sp.]|nr:serine protease [Fuscovulum sp.]